MMKTPRTIFVPGVFCIYVILTAKKLCRSEPPAPPSFWRGGHGVAATVDAPIPARRRKRDSKGTSPFGAAPRRGRPPRRREKENLFTREYSLLEQLRLLPVIVLPPRSKETHRAWASGSPVAASAYIFWRDFFTAHGCCALCCANSASAAGSVSARAFKSCKSAFSGCGGLPAAPLPLGVRSAPALSSLARSVNIV